MKGVSDSLKEKELECPYGFEWNEEKQACVPWAELKKRIIEACCDAWDEEDRGYDDLEKPIMKVLEEAKKEFPFLETWILQHPNVNDGQKIIEGCLKAQEEWFVKWFGMATADP